MKSMMILLLVLATAALGQTVEIEGKRITLEGKLSAKPAVAVTVASVYRGSVGPDRSDIVTGYLVSNLPHQYFRITVIVTFWRKSSSQPEGIGGFWQAKTVIDCPAIDRKVKWKAVARNIRGGTDSLGATDLRYTTEVSFSKHVPDSVSSAHR